MVKIHIPCYYRGMKRNSLRKHTLLARDQLTPLQRQEKSRAVHNLLNSQSWISDVNHLFVYVHFRSEVETMALIRQLIVDGKTVSVPVTLAAESRLLAVRLTDPDSQLTVGYYGILEPTPDRIAAAAINPATLDAVLVPGSVFDQLGGRLGYGGGFYDRFLIHDAPQALRIGLAFARQIVDRVPMEPHDQYMDKIITEQQIIDCQRNLNAQDSNL